jgi:dihydroxyacetone synthase
MAIASKQLAATYNRDEVKVVDNKIWCFTGDGCLQEGVGQEGMCATCSWRIGYELMIYCSCFDRWTPWPGQLDLDL